LLETFEQALSSCTSHAPSRLAHLSASSRQSLLQTLLFLGVTGLSRTWDLRGYTGDALGLLTNRSRAYGYWHTERFLSQLAQANGADIFTDALAKWTTCLWHVSPDTPSTFYVDGHRKPVYSEVMLPRGLVGRLSCVLGCRALVLLHDEQGHPLFVTTHRGDQHLTVGLPSIIARYEQASRRTTIKRVVVDREGMGAEFLSTLALAGRTVVSVLKTDQYDGLKSFTDIGSFVPWCLDQDDNVTREVAPASIALPLPDHPGEQLSLRVALIRDLRRHIPVVPPQEERELSPRWDADLARDDRKWWEDGWQATPAPAIPTAPKLIPIVTTAPQIDAVELAQTYIHRWPAQENIIKDFLLPLGLDINHGYAKTAVENSEMAKRRTALEKRLANVQRWVEAARKRSHNACKLYRKRCTLTKERADALYRDLNQQQMDLERQSVEYWKLRVTIKELKATADAEIEEYQQRQWKAYHTSNQEFTKCEKYCQQQRDILRALEDLKANERTMYELDNQKDQVMTVFKVALTNLVMWTRDHYFPASYAHATWKRLAPFFHLPGLITQGREEVLVELRPFNDRQYNDNLKVLCEHVNDADLRLPDGRRLLFAIKGIARPILDVQKRRVA
jgi:hypothetical protein